MGTLCLSLVVALCRGGRLRRLGEAQIRALWAILLALLFQFSISFLLDRWPDLPRYVLTGLFVLSYLMLAVALYANRHLPGALWMVLGATLNFLVIVVNGGRMPVHPWALALTGQEDFMVYLGSDACPTHLLSGPGTNLWFLGDCMGIPYIHLKSAFSVGDVCLMIGLFWAVQRLMVPGARSRRARPAGAGGG